MNVGDILNYSYTGAVQSVTLPAGKYKLEVWGAQGGNGDNRTTYAGGKGGYAKGTLTLAASTTVNIYVGGEGKSSTSTGAQAGGYNGGGAGGYGRGGSGGGATDVRAGGTALSNRIIVAGGGGGGAYYSGYTGGVGGGTSGGAGNGYSTTYNAKGGSQTAGGAGGSYKGDYKGANGSLGQGGAAASTTTANYGRGGGGGGGYYGGGGSGYRGNSRYYYHGQSGGGGGSGYVDSTLTDTQNTAGSSSFPAPGGGTETGHSGDGYARITVLELPIPAPSNLRKTGATYSSVSIAWDAVTGVTGYKVYKDNVLVSTQAGTTYTAGGMPPGESHTYKVTAYQGANESDPATVTASTDSITTPGSLQQTAQTYTSVTLGWTTSGSVDGYHVYRGGTLIATTTSLSYTDTGLSPQTSYSYSVKAYVDSYESAAATLTASTKTIPTPTNFVVSGTDYTSLTLSWDSYDVDGYKLYRGSALLTTTSGSSYTDTGLIPDTSYSYTLKAYFQSAESSAAETTGKTEWAIYYVGPEVSSATITPNPTTVGTSITLQVIVAEAAKVLPPTYRYSGELVCGEQ